MFDFKGKVVAVSGSTRGIGLEIAKEFYLAGASVAICGRSYTPALLDEISKDDKSRLFGMVADVSCVSDCQKFLIDVKNFFGEIDILVNNAGIGALAPDLELTEEQWDMTMAINVKANFFSSQFMIKQWINEGKTGSIVNIGSIAGQTVLGDCVGYCSSKAAVEMITKCLAKDFGKKGIRVNAIGPGSIPTSMNRDKYEDPFALKALQERLPLGRQGKAKEIADAVMFLASDSSSYTTGQILFVDGGWLLG